MTETKQVNVIGTYAQRAGGINSRNSRGREEAAESEGKRGAEMGTVETRVRCFGRWDERRLRPASRPTQPVSASLLLSLVQCYRPLLSSCNTCQYRRALAATAGAFTDTCAHQLNPWLFINRREHVARDSVYTMPRLGRDRRTRFTYTRPSLFSIFHARVTAAVFLLVAFS